MLTGCSQGGEPDAGLKTRASGGDRDAQFQLGVIFDFGEGVAVEKMETALARLLGGTIGLGIFLVAWQFLVNVYGSVPGNSDAATTNATPASRANFAVAKNAGAAAAIRPFSMR